MHFIWSISDSLEFEDCNDNVLFSLVKILPMRNHNNQQTANDIARILFSL